MKLKKTVCLAVCLLMLLIMAAGCGQSTSNGDKSSSSSASSTQQTSTALPEGKLSAEPIKLVYVHSLGTKPDAVGNERVRKLILQKTNIDLQVEMEVNTTDYASKMNIMLAAGDHFDMFYDGAVNLAGGMEIPRLIKEDVVRPIDDLIPSYAPDALKILDPSTWGYVKQDGKTYGIPGQTPLNQVAMQYRKDWLDADGLKVPTTIEEWEAVAQDFKDKHKDPGFIQVWDGALQSMFVGLFVPQGDMNFLDTDGKIKPVIMHKNFKDYLAKMADWYGKGYIHKEIATMKTDQAFTLLNTAKAGLCHAWGDPSGFTDAAKKVDPKTEYIWGPPLKSSLQEGVFPKYDRIYDWLGVTKMCKYPEAAVRFLNWASATTEGYELTMMGEQGVDWILNKRDGDLVYYNTGTLSTEKKYHACFTGVWIDTLYTKYFIGNTKSTYYEDCGTYKLGDRPDYWLFYDNSTMKSKDKKADMDQYLAQEKYKIIMGLEPVSAWDNVIQNWLNKGGGLYIDDLTEEYNAWKASHK